MLSEVDPNQSEKMKMATMEVDVEKDSTNGVKYVESVKKEVVSTLNNQFEKEAIDTAPVMTDVKQVTDAPVPTSALDANNDVKLDILSNPAEKDKLDISPTFIEQGKNILICLTVTPKLLYVINQSREI